VSDEAEHAVVFRTSQPDETPSLAARLADAGIPFEIRIVVQAERETQAVELIEAYMRSIGAAPHEEPAAEAPAEDALLPCPNCEADGIALNRPCKGCGYEILQADSAPSTVKEHSPAAKTFCPECRDPLTHASGRCKCGEELEPLESSDLLCPTLAHVLYRDTAGGIVCKACRRVWVDAAA
jgi:hypothetical protein